jgi:hypothetical protein
MVTRKFDKGIEITLPEDLRIATALPKRTRRSGPLPVSGAIPMPADSGQTHDDDSILTSLEQSGLELVQELEIEPEPQTGTHRRSAAPAGGTAEFKVDLRENEEAVMLLEQDGMYLWKYAGQTKEAPSMRRRGGGREAAQKQVIFTIEIAGPVEADTDEKKRSILGKVKEFAWGKVKAYVLKFIAAASVELARNHLERNVSRGLVHIKSTDPETWQVVSGLKQFQLPTDRAPKIFLFVHGTFSSTVGAFGALGATPWGRSFLQSTFKTYDAVVGFNHATLSEDPLQNAQQLLDIFQAIDWPVAPQIDVVAHSRGGLVIRSLIEKLLPEGAWQPTFNRVIFVASTNSGTLLAEPENWESLVNLYTNLAAGACRVIGLIAPQTKVVSLVLSDVIQSIGSFIKYCADSAIADRLIPGLSAMEPDGAFIKDINLLQEAQPGVEKSYYCIITSEFKPRLTGTHEPKELPKRFLSLLSGTLIERLMKEANDLVVNTKSMGAIDLESGNFIKEQYDFGVNSQVYHTNYFTRPEVANALTRWLSLPHVPQNQVAGEGTAPKRRTRSVRGGSIPDITPASPAIQPLPTSVPLDITLSPQVDTDIITIDCSAPVESLRAEIVQKAPSYVVVRRPYRGQVLNYALEAEEALRTINTQTNTSIINALNLHETDASGTHQIGEKVESKEFTGGNIMASRDVIVLNDTPVGVVPEKKELPDAEELARRAQLVSQPKTEEERIMVRRSMPTFTTSSEERTTRGAPKPAPKVTCYFRADMDAEVIVKRTTTIIVTISREMLEQMSGGISEINSANLSIEKKILVRVVAKSNFIVIDENDGRADIDIPVVNQPTELLFDVRATEEGEGEIWVLFRQEQVIVAKLILKPKVVKSKSLAAEKVKAEKVTEDPKPLYKPLHQLDIEERKTEDGFIYRYRINSPGLQIKLQFDSKPIKGDREKYVADLYKQIEDRWLSSGRDEENFAQELRAFGAELFDELIPEKLQKLLWQRRRDFDSIQVISSEPFIPWELVHLRDPGKRGMPDETIFLAQMGLIRWLDGAGENGWPPDVIKIRNGRVRYVIPKYPHPDYKLPEAEKEQDFLVSQFAAQEANPESGEIRKIISRPGVFDLLHFACHGVAESDSINEASLLMQGRVEDGKYIIDSLNATTTSKFSNLKADDNEPMVVLNACQAGRAGYKLTGIGGFANAFLMGGAGAFVGTLWSVGDSPARTFTETLYGALDKGKNLSEATIDARNAAKEAGEATWLAYVVYGHPHLKVAR